MRTLGFVFPEISTDGRTLYENMFHPKVKALLEKSGKEFQPVSIVTGEEPVTIIGANMGGKTVVLKMLGLCQLLFRFGFGIPASGARIAVRDNVRWSMGEHERPEQGLSSFAAEVVRLDGMIRAARAGERALLLVDEPARTTNPVEGTALAEAFLRIIAQTQADLVLTTHYNLGHVPGRRLRVRGLEGGRMNYALEETSDAAVPHEAVATARELGADPEWLECALKIIND
jgi:DNA mismatch repair ATPase MutS